MALHLLFFVSGALGLVYEVLWMRQFTVLFGSTVLAMTATLSGFFLGTTLGSLTLGPRSGRWSRPLRAFGLLEIGVGLGALGVPLILQLYARLYAVLQGSLAGSPWVLAPLQLLLAMAAVGLPTFFMGGTLPVLGEAVAPSGRHLGAPVGGLYAANVLGAAAGALAVPFLLLPWLGVRNASLAAVAGSFAVGSAACLLGWDTRRADEAPLEEKRRQPARPVSATAILVFAAWSGFCTLGLQVLWTRMFSFVHESSVYSFAVVLATFLVGLSAGAATALRLLRRAASAERILGWAWSAAGILIVVSPVLLQSLTRGFEYLPAGNWLASLGRLLLVAALTLFPACLGLGMALPLLMELSGGERRSAGALLGRLVSVNTAGAIVGPLAVTFLLAPRLGLWKSLVLLGLGCVLAGVRAGLGRGEAGGVALLLLAVLALLQPWRLPPVRLRAEQGERLVSVREGSYGTTAVVEDDRDRWITVNNSYVLGGAATAGEERWQGHLPLLLHPAPRRVAFVGMGTGIPAGAALRHPVERILALEIVPEVAAAAREDFAAWNARVASDPRVSVVADDGRNVLASTPQAFDVIVQDLLVPWRASESGLYTQEHLESARRALAPGGLFCQWLPLYQLSEQQLGILLRTFGAVFPRVTVWRGNFLPVEPTLALVGHTDPGPLDVGAIDARAAALAPSMDATNPFLKHPAGVWLFLVGPWSPQGPRFSGGRRNSDNAPWVELLSPRGEPALVGSGLESLLQLVAEAPFEPTPLAGLDAQHRSWQRTGMSLARASLVPGAEGEQRVLTILRTLPPELQRSLDVPPP